jgi:hypothetical protein
VDGLRRYRFLVFIKYMLCLIILVHLRIKVIKDIPSISIILSKKKLDANELGLVVVLTVAN